MGCDMSMVLVDTLDIPSILFKGNNHDKFYKVAMEDRIIKPLVIYNGSYTGTQLTLNVPLEYLEHNIIFRNNILYLFSCLKVTIIYKENINNKCSWLEQSENIVQYTFEDAYYLKSTSCNIYYESPMTSSFGINCNYNGSMKMCIYGKQFGYDPDCSNCMWINNNCPHAVPNYIDDIHCSLLYWNYGSPQLGPIFKLNINNHNLDIKKVIIERLPS